MNKLIFQSILVATVLMAGVFALMPTEQATAVHTTIQSTQFTKASLISSADLSIGFTCDSDQDFIVHFIIGETEVDGTTITIASTVDGVTLTLTGDNPVSGTAGYAGFGATGFSATMAAAAADQIVIDGTATVDVHVSLITGSGATASCV